MWWLDSITDSMNMNLSKLWETVEDRGAWHAAVHGATNSWSRIQSLNNNNIHGRYKKRAFLYSSKTHSDSLMKNKTEVQHISILRPWDVLVSPKVEHTFKNWWEVHLIQVFSNLEFYPQMEFYLQIEIHPPKTSDVTLNSLSQSTCNSLAIPDGSIIKLYSGSEH